MNLVRIIIAITACLAMIVVMTGLSFTSHWLGNHLSTIAFIVVVAVFGAACLAIGISIDKREQKRLGIKRPLFIWTNEELDRVTKEALENKARGMD